MINATGYFVAHARVVVVEYKLCENLKAFGIQHDEHFRTGCQHPEQQTESGQEEQNETEPPERPGQSEPVPESPMVQSESPPAPIEPVIDPTSEYGYPLPVEQWPGWPGQTLDECTPAESQHARAMLDLYLKLYEDASNREQQALMAQQAAGSAPGDKPGAHGARRNDPEPDDDDMDMGI